MKDILKQQVPMSTVFILFIILLLGQVGMCYYTITASNVSYDNSQSKIQAQDVQAAIDEIDTNVDTIGENAWQKNGNDLYFDAGNVGLGVTPDANFHVKGNLSQPLSGTIAINSGSTVVTGTDTKFTEELLVGDAIKIANEAFTVIKIVDDSQLVIDSEHQAGALGATAFTDSDLLLVENGAGVEAIRIDKSGRMNVNKFCFNGNCQFFEKMCNHTSKTFNGNLGGVNGADVKCQEEFGENWYFLYTENQKSWIFRQHPQYWYINDSKISVMACYGNGCKDWTDTVGIASLLSPYTDQWILSSGAQCYTENPLWCCNFK